MSFFIPKAYTKEPIIIRMTTDKIELIDRLATQHSLSRSGFIVQCVEYALEHMVLPEDGEKPQE